MYDATNLVVGVGEETIEEQKLRDYKRLKDSTSYTGLENSLVGDGSFDGDMSFGGDSVGGSELGFGSKRILNERSVDQNSTDFYENSTNSNSTNSNSSSFDSTLGHRNQFTHPIFSRSALIGICLFWLLMLVGPCIVASIENKRRLRRNEKLYTWIYFQCHW